MAGLDEVGPRTVVWLNETQHYLLTPTNSLGEQVAAKLRTLLRDPERAPVLVLGTTWPEYWQALTAPSLPDDEDTHAQARALMVGHIIRVPEAFTERAVQALHDAAADDPRLAQAAEHAEQGHVAQYLANVTDLAKHYLSAYDQLVETYRNAPPAAWALVTAAMDARRLGHGPDLPLGLLEAAASGYLTDQQLEGMGEDWLEQAVDYATACRRGISPLIRQSGDLGNARPHYRLADALAQHARVSRRTVVPPEQFWQAAVRNTHRPEDLHSLAEAAAHRWRLRHAAQLYLRASSVGGADARLELARLLSEAGKLEEEEQLFREAADLGGADARVELARLLSEVGRLEEAEQLLREVATGGDVSALRNLAVVREQAGDLEEARRLFREAADIGDVSAFRALARLQTRAGGQKRAERLFREAARAGDVTALRDLAVIRESAGDQTEAERLARQAADAGDNAALLHLVRTRAHAIPWHELRIYGLEADGRRSCP
ncbi:tetratricopeptide repeat protein [Streptomyces sp. P9-2B-2]|uniref:tetratricopeptide repeat protein n=1 Tax=Streptomyces sp. P9-2B-2 TaxID=3057114 RepID=UPI0025B5B442|nr:tetratricopeptide repeat protein [Streptomyces sp. P9-2B-2]WJY41561.1 tetratricopeptide repeat protein [Streptomyces sp. P9-2B-2]